MRSIGVSIVIPCYNSGMLLHDAIMSIIEQDYKYRTEVVVVDDGSVDTTTKKILKETRKHHMIRVLHLKENRGAQYARNIGIKEAKYSYIFMMDSDDRLSTEDRVKEVGTYTDRAIEILESRSEIAFIHPMVTMFGNQVGPIYSSYPLTQSLIVAKHHVPTFIVYRRRDAIAAGLYDETILKWQDWSFAVALMNNRFLNGLKNEIVFLSEPYYLYRIHDQTERISARNICEKEMVRRTIIRNISIFQHEFGKRNNLSELLNIVYLKRPSPIEKLSRVIEFDPDVAAKLIERLQREGTSADLYSAVM